MRAKKLVITKLYGYLNKTIEFNDKINLLVGINGSGKTSVLNILNWLLTPSLPTLCVVEFERIELEFEYEKNNYLIQVDQSDKELKYFITDMSRERVYTPLTVNLKIPTYRLAKNEFQRERYLEEYQKLGPDKEEADTWALIFNQLPNPIIIGLDRYIYTQEKNETHILQGDNPFRFNKKDVFEDISPVEEVQRLASREYSIYKNRIVELNRELNNKIMLSAFYEITPSTIRELESASNISIEQIETLHTKVEGFIRETMIAKGNRHSLKKTNESLVKIENYFNHLKDLVLHVERSADREYNILYLSNISQFKKIKELIQEFEVFETKSQKYYSDIKIYLDTINKFLVDSSKQLKFDKSLSQLVVDVLDKLGDAISKNRDIKTLSSGERQILILFTYLKFHNKSGTIFIIDEPELSLHPKWQEDFLSAVETLTPQSTQIIVATHSPIIVGSNRDYCKVLLPYN